VINNGCISFVIVGSLVLIRMHGILHAVFNLGQSLGAFDAFAFLVLTYKKLGEVNQRSLEFLNSWKRNVGYLEDPVMRIRMKKLIKSSRPLGVDLGEFGHYNRQGSIRVIGKVVSYIVRILMLTNPFGI